MLRHGRYLVRDVGMCADCHTPRDRHGKEIVARWLRGGPLNFKPAHPIPEWARHSSDLIHLARRWTTQQWIRFLRSGIAPNGKPARPPMPDIHLSYYDARAVTAYIRSLKH
ncbi:Cytochrome c family protein [mine drainage metagenome]|uniref:Cytochrome c family protein n=1 Tax=mine drainage metagenome TaxID=410659 RepID=T0ZSH4_9ZZZZ